MSTVTVDVDYSSGTTPSITFESNGSPWDSTIDFGDTVTFSLSSASASSGFGFSALTVWFGSEPDTEPAETFTPQKQPASGGTYQGVTLSNIMVSASSIEFTVANQCSAGEDLTLDVEVVIQDSSSNAFFTSRDPQITIRKPT